MLASNVLGLIAIACIVVAVAALATWPVALLVLGVILLLPVYALYTQAQTPSAGTAVETDQGADDER